MDASKGQLKRDYSAEKIGGTKGRPYKPVRIPKKQLEYSEPHEEEKKESRKGTRTALTGRLQIHQDIKRNSVR